MTGNGNGRAVPERRLIADAVAARRRAQLVSGLRGLAKPAANGDAAGDGAGAAAPRGVAAPTGAANRSGAANGDGAVSIVAISDSVRGGATADAELCEICGVDIPADHRHLLQLVERRIICTCEGCWAMRSGEGDYRPTGNRTLWLPGLDVPEDLWAGFQIPIGLAFFMSSTVTACVVALYPSPAGATESELHFESWQRMCELNPVMAELEPDIEGLVVNRLADPPAYAIAPIDRCYELTGVIKASWEGISGGPRVEAAVAQFFERLRAKAVSA